MRTATRSVVLSLGLLATVLGAEASSGAPPATQPSAGLGGFEAEVDIGGAGGPGVTHFDPARKEFRITGSGENMWEGKDAFHYVWKRASGDLTATADVAFAEKKGNEHRKGGWVVRQSLEPDAPYADAVVHADGLISLQYRLVKGGPTLELQSPIRGPAALKLERTGTLFTLFVARPGKPFQPVGSVTVPLVDPVYVGLGVCSHEAKSMATVLFTGVELTSHGVAAADKRVLESNLEVLTVKTGERRLVHTTRKHVQAPNWSRDGKGLLYNQEGKLFRIDADGGQPAPVTFVGVEHLNNDHGLSPDGKWIALSDEPGDGANSFIRVAPAAGGEARLVTALSPSYWHGWSPDGKTLAYCAARKDEYDIYTIPADAEKSTGERRLTTTPGLDDGPDYSPDGRTIYFNSERTGRMQLWRMDADGRNQKRVTFDDAWADWFPHPSPDGKWLVFLSYDGTVKEHPENKDVVLRIMPARGKGKPRVLARLFGGQGTINVPSWSPDSKSIAFVSYRLVTPRKNGE